MRIKSILILALFFIIINIPTSGQGCVAIRGNSACGTNMGYSSNLEKGSFNLQLGYRYFKSFRHFRGDHEETHRIDEGTEVINHSSFLDVALNYGITNRFYATAILPFVSHKRSSMYEHGGNPPNGLGERHTTTSKGISDIRLGIGYWLFDPSKSKFNYAFGVGVKLPTGNYNYQDVFYNQGEMRDQDIETVVDQSIQPGDGGLGFTFDIQGWHPVTDKISIETNLFYLLNFQETNGISTRNGSSEFSCPDQFAIRLGGSYRINNNGSFYLGGRAEGVPASDLVGGSAGYRRPGYAISLEPGIGYAVNQISFFLSVPIALYRNRIQSYQDKERTELTGNYRHGDAAFADYLINFGLSYRLNQKHYSKEEMKDVIIKI